MSRSQEGEAEALGPLGASLTCVREAEAQAGRASRWTKHLQERKFSYGLRLLAK